MKNKFITAILLIPVLVVGCSSQAEQESSYEYTMDFDALDYVELCDYTSIPISVDESILEVTDEDVEEEIQSYLNLFSENTYINSRTYIIDGDILVIDYKGTDEDGDSFSETNKEITLGSQSIFPEEFEEILLKCNVGDEIEESVTYDDDWSNVYYRGTTIEYCIKIKGIKESTTTELTDELVEEFGIEGVSSTEDFYEYVNDVLKATKENEYLEEIGSDIVSYFIDNSSFKTLPDEFLDNILNMYMKYYEGEAEYYGYDDYLEYLIDEKSEVDDESEAYEYIQSEINSTAQILIIGKAIWQNENLTFDDGDDAALLEYIQELGYENIETYEDYGYDSNYALETLIKDTAFDYVLYNYTDYAN